MLVVIGIWKFDCDQKELKSNLVQWINGILMSINFFLSLSLRFSLNATKKL